MRSCKIVTRSSYSRKKGFQSGERPDSIEMKPNIQGVTTHQIHGIRGEKRIAEGR